MKKSESESLYKFRAVIFDMDNTLHDLHRAAFSAGDALMAYCGFFGDLHFYMLNLDKPTMVKESISRYAEDFGIKNTDECLNLFKAAELKSLELFDGIEDMLSELKAGCVKTAIISNSDSKMMKKRLNELGIEKYFDLIVTPETFGVKKPNPEVYEKTLQALNVTASETAMAGDRIDRDVEPARVNGIFGIHAWYGSFEKKDRICCAETPMELIKYIKQN